MQSGGKRSEHYTERGSPIGDMQTGRQAGRQTKRSCSKGAFCFGFGI